jgi:BirA family biotin operon repressor/biotin-[acetyl-CoA-carboxylase] ligase
MHIIKLSAINSTNLYLKNLTLKQPVKNFTVVVADYQTKGRGQMGTVWESDSGKNLTFSVLVSFDKFKITSQFYLSMAVSLAVLAILKKYVKNSVKIKWPNDILADKDKLAGILIENTLKGEDIKHAIIGIGLNVNQTKFSSAIENVTSLKQLVGFDIDKDKLVVELVNSIKKYGNYIVQQDFEVLKELYLKELYKINVPSMFEDALGNYFLGKIKTIAEGGELVIELENETTRQFNLKEIKFASRS